MQSRDGGLILRGQGGLIHRLTAEHDTVRHKFTFTCCLIEAIER
jgi:hypothetical protein